MHNPGLQAGGYHCLAPLVQTPETCLPIRSVCAHGDGHTEAEGFHPIEALLQVFVLSAFVPHVDEATKAGDVGHGLDISPAAILVALARQKRKDSELWPIIPEGRAGFDFSYRRPGHSLQQYCTSLEDRSTDSKAEPGPGDLQSRLPGRRHNGRCSGPPPAQKPSCHPTTLALPGCLAPESCPAWSLATTLDTYSLDGLPACGQCPAFRSSSTADTTRSQPSRVNKGWTSSSSAMDAKGLFRALAFYFAPDFLRAAMAMATILLPRPQI